MKINISFLLAERLELEQKIKAIDFILLKKEALSTSQSINGKDLELGHDGRNWSEKIIFWFEGKMYFGSVWKDRDGNLKVYASYGVGHNHICEFEEIEKWFYFEDLESVMSFKD